jgi:hypothetical protein
MGGARAALLFDAIARAIPTDAAVFTVVVEQVGLRRRGTPRWCRAIDETGRILLS